MLKFLLHTCCAPCSIVVIDELKRKFDLSVFFYNPNIYPLAEYEKRKAEVVKICHEWQVPVIDMDYEASKWQEAMKGLEDGAEGGVRCLMCFKFRLAKTVEYAKKNGFRYFGTSITSGRNKNAELINLIGRNFGKHYGVKFYDVDWKKGGRQERAAAMVKERGIYRQNYCGCVYSRHDT